MKNLFGILLFAGAVTACNGDDGTTDDTDGNDTDAGAMFAVALHGSGYDPHDGQTINAIVVDADGNELGSGTTTVSAGAFIIEMADIPEGTHKVSWHADMNGNGDCDNAPDDHVWTQDVTVSGQDASVEHTHATDFADCTYFQ